MAEFFKKNRQMLGFSSKVRSLTTAVHEYVTNALDACEEAGILPDIYVKLERIDEDKYVLTVRDSGPGIPPKIVPRVFGKLLAGTKFHRMIPSRGQQGIGAAGVTLFAQMTTGQPVHVKTGEGDGVVFEMDIKIDVNRNEPIVLNKRSYIDYDWRGTEVTATLGDVSYNRGKYSVYEYLWRTALANPHAQIVFVDPDGKRHVFYRTSFEPVHMAKEAKPHPLGVTTDDLLTIAKRTKARTVANMFLREFQAFGKKALNELRAEVGDLLDKKPSELEWNEAERIVKAMRKIKFRAPSTDVLITIGADKLRASLRSNLKPKFLAVVERPPRVYRGGIPFQVEAAVAIGGEIKGFDIYRYANRSPLLFDSGACAITQAVNSIDWKRYGIQDLKQVPLIIFVNVVSTHIPYTSAGKQAIADVPEVMKELRYALMDVARKVREYMTKVNTYQELLHKKKILDHYLPEVASAFAKILEKPESDIRQILEQAIAEKYKKLEELMKVVG